MTLYDPCLRDERLGHGGQKPSSYSSMTNSTRYCDTVIRYTGWRRHSRSGTGYRLQKVRGRRQTLPRLVQMLVLVQMLPWKARRGMGHRDDNSVVDYPHEGLVVGSDIHPAAGTTGRKGSGSRPCVSRFAWCRDQRTLEFFSLWRRSGADRGLHALCSCRRKRATDVCGFHETRAHFRVVRKQIHAVHTVSVPRLHGQLRRIWKVNPATTLPRLDPWCVGVQRLLASKFVGAESYRDG